MSKQLDYRNAREKFIQYRNYLQKQIRGSKLALGKEGVLEFNLSTKKQIDDILALSGKVKTNIVALRDAEYLQNSIEDTLFSISILRVEIKTVLDASLHDRQLQKMGGSEALRDIRDIYGKICDYSEAVQRKFNMIAQLIDTLRTMSSTLRWQHEQDVTTYRKL